MQKRQMVRRQCPILSIGTLSLLTILLFNSQILRAVVLSLTEHGLEEIPEQVFQWVEHK